MSRGDPLAGLGRPAREFGDLPAAIARGVDAAVGRIVHALGAGSPPALHGPSDLQTSSHFTVEEIRLLAEVESALAKGLELHAWWRDHFARNAFDRRFELGRTFNDPAIGFGFFDRTEVDGAPLPVMGNFQEMFYDRPKTPAGQAAADSAAWMRDQVRQFGLRYFMRVSDFRAPEGYVDTWRPPTSGLFEPLSWCPSPDVASRGFGFQQLYFKRRGGEIGRFPEEERFAVVDLRELGETYEWIVVKVCIFDFSFSFAPFGSGFPKIVVPLAEDSYLVLSRDFVVDQDAPSPGVLGRYGLGYAFVKNPATGLIGYGPGEFEAAFETITFEVNEDGVVRVPMVFVANRPRRIVNLRFDPVGTGLKMADLFSFGAASTLFEPMRRAMDPVIERVPLLAGELDPVYAYVEIANLLSGGLADEALCISREQLDKDFLVKHYIQHYQAIGGSLATWRLIPDWLAGDDLPEWVHRGRSL